MFVPLVAVSALSQQFSAEQIYETVTPRVMTLTVNKGHGTESMGTAFLAVRRDVAVTAWHVLKGARSVSAKFSDGTTVDIRGLIDKDADQDIALIAVDAQGREPLPLAAADPKVGSKAFVIGSPKGMEFSMSDGIISQTPKLDHGLLYQFTCPVSPGNSGGPLIDGGGRVLGVVSWQLKDAQNLNFAVPVRNLGLLDQLKAVVPFSQPSGVSDTAGRLLTSVDDDALGELLAKGGFDGSPSDDGTGKTAFLMDVEGTKVTLFQYGSIGGHGPTTNLSLSVGYRTNGLTELAKVNRFNQGHRFARSYRDNDGTLYLENDIDLVNGVGPANVSSFVQNFTEVVRQFEDEVLGKGQSRSLIVQEKSASSLRPIGDESLAKILKSCGYETQTADDGTGKTRFDFACGNARVSLYQYSETGGTGPTTSLTLSVGYDMDKPADMGKVNAFNQASRFVKGFLDEAGDPFLVADMDLTGGVTPESVAGFVKTFVKAIPEFESQIVR